MQRAREDGQDWLVQAIFDWQNEAHSSINIFEPVRKSSSFLVQPAPLKRNQIKSNVTNPSPANRNAHLENLTSYSNKITKLDKIMLTNS